MSNTQGGNQAPAEANQPTPETKTKKKPVLTAERKEVVKKKMKATKVKKAGKVKPKAKLKAKKAKGKSKADKTTLNFKVVPTEAKLFKAKADKLCNGNMTQMVRLSILAWRPNKKALGEIRRTTRA